MYQEIAKVITYLVESKHHFALFRMPDSADIQLYVDLGKLNENGFVLQAYSYKKEKLWIADDIVLVNEQINIALLQNSLKGHLLVGKKYIDVNSGHYLTPTTYALYVNDIVANCKNTSLQKAVAARMVSKKIDKNFRLEEMFIHLLQAHPLAMVNLFYHHKAGLWLGASPELLVRSNDNKFETVALAGTKLNTENRAFTAKEIEEQDIVKQYIVSLLAAENIKADAAAEAETVIAGNVAHLQTKIAFQTDKTVLELAKILHPTPAVCGFPKEEAQAMIRKYEGNQRQLYAGYIGVVNVQQQALYVHLRCMQVLENELIIHVGAGITKDSDAAKEWQETENKAQTLLRWVE